MAANGSNASGAGRPWEGIAPEEDLIALEARGNRLERAPKFGNRPALVIVDMTRTFVDPGYAASCAETGGTEATAATQEVLAHARVARIPVFFTKALQATSGVFLPVELGRGLPDRPEHLATLLATPEGLAEGNEIADQIAPLAGEVVIAKPKPSAFFGTPLGAYLTYHGVDNIIVTGMVTSGCVRATVIDAYMRNIYVNVVQEAVADFSVFQHRTSLLDMHAKYAHVTYLSDVLTFLDGLAGGVPDGVPPMAGAVS